VIAGFALAALVVLMGAHLVLVGSLARISLWRAPLALLVPPLAAYWAWIQGMRVRVFVWLGAVAAYALGVALASL
jgi:hypothetical protein